MGRKNSKVQRKKFFSHPKNKGKVFKRKEAPKNCGNSIRVRGNFVVLPTEDFKTVPNCLHGPCLLFGTKENGRIAKRYFSCAVYRNDPESCDFKADVDNDNIISLPDLKVPKTTKWNYGCIPKTLKITPKNAQLVFCRQCNNIYENKHSCPSEYVTRKELKKPTQFLQAIEKQNGEAQFFFTDESLAVLMNMVKDSKADGIICLGTPRLFESLKAKKEGRKKLFLLDIDRRYAHFYLSSHFAQYSMLVHHFYDPKAIGKLMKFLANCSSILLVCDPPFGVLMEPLMESLVKLEAMHAEARKQQEHNFYISVLVPYFIGKHMLRMDGSKFWMSDYRVTYTNHKVFNRASKTTVRIFTNLHQSAVSLSDVEGYKFCEFCEKYVHELNKHCFMCQSCTSKDGSTMKHCNLCSRCTKISYRHCRKCSKCHLEGRCYLAGSEEFNSCNNE